MSTEEDHKRDLGPLTWAVLALVTNLRRSLPFGPSCSAVRTMRAQFNAASPQAETPPA